MEIPPQNLTPEGEKGKIIDYFRHNFGQYNRYSSLPEEEQRVLRERSLFNEGELPQGDEVKVEGVAGDSDLASLDESLKTILGDDLLRRSNVSRVLYMPEKVNIFFSDDEDYYLPIDIFKNLITDMPEVLKYKVRAGNLYAYNQTLDRKDIPMKLPIHVYSFEGEDLNQTYLQDLPGQLKGRAYKVGTVVHEFAHSLSHYVLTDEDREEWLALSNKAGSLTQYTDKYLSGAHGSNMFHEEQFAEAVRLFTTTPDFLLSKHPGIYSWIQGKFPDIKHI